MNTRVAIFFTAALLLLTGCTVRSLQTSGPSEHTVRNVYLVLDSALPNSIEIRKMSNYGGVKITEADKQKAGRDSAALLNVIRKGFREQFPAMAAKRGLMIVPAQDSDAQLKVSVASVTFSCSDMGCAPRLELKGQLLRSTNDTALWTFSSDVGAATVLTGVSDDIFQTFAAKLLDTMVNDRVIR